MQSAFKELIIKIIDDYGIFILRNSVKFKGLLYDYAKGKYKEDITLFILALEERWYERLRDSSNPAILKEVFMQRLENEFNISHTASAMYLDEFCFVLKSFETKKPENDTLSEEFIKLEKDAQKGDCRAMYELGCLLEKQSWYEESNYWFKKSAQKSLFLYESSLRSAQKTPDPQGFVKIPGGAFTMGSPISDPSWSKDETQHKVKISAFYLGIYTVTQKEYEDICKNNQSLFIGETLPVENITWYAAINYCNTRSLIEKLTPSYTISRDYVSWNPSGTGYRLPTEAEWEYACRAGTDTPFNTGEHITTDEANYNGKDEAKRRYMKRTLPVGSFPPNAWGLYDMHGNVWEWCWDWYGEYSIWTQQDPRGPSSGFKRVFRGGSWNYKSRDLRSACRNSDVPTYQGSDVGFRLALPCRSCDD